jgi:hypothetical protein
MPFGSGQSRHVGRGESTIPRKSNDVVNAQLFGDLGRPIGASVVDHEHLDAVDARHGARQVGHGRTLLSAPAARVKPPRSGSG